MTVIELCAPRSPLGGDAAPPMHLVEQRFDVPAPVDVEAEVGRQWGAVWSGVELPRPRSSRSGSAAAASTACPASCGPSCARLRRRRLPSVHRLGDGLARQRHLRRPGGGAGRTRHHRGDRRGAGVRLGRCGRPRRGRRSAASSSTRAAAEADGIVLVNRVKPHTDFVGRVESGLMKMLVIGLGNDAGATAYHRHALERGLADVVNTVGHALLDRRQGRPRGRPGREPAAPACHGPPARRRDWEEDGAGAARATRARSCRGCRSTTSTCCWSTRWART